MTIKSNNPYQANSQRLIREFIEAVIAEEESNQLYNAFIQPFADVGTTALAGAEKLTSQTWTVLKGIIFGIPTLFVPFWEYDYKTFREQEKVGLDAIKKKYEKVLKSNFDALTTNDAFGLSFLLAPGSIMAAQLAVKVPEVALHILEVLLGGSETLANIRTAINPVSSVGFHDPGGHVAGAWNGMGGGGGGWGGDYGDGGMYEAVQSALPASSPGTKELLAFLKDKKNISQIENSPIAKSMKADAVKLIIDHVRKFMMLQNYDQMRQMAPNDAGFDKIGQELSKLNQTGKVPIQDNQAAAQSMIPAIKKAYKDLWIKQLQQMLGQYPNAQAEILFGIKQISALS